MAKRSHPKQDSLVLDNDPSLKYSVQIDNKRGNSICWNYFGFVLKNGEIFDNKYLYCRLCFPAYLNFRYALSTSTSNLNKHLQTVHSIQTTSTAAAIRRTADILENNTSIINKKSNLARKMALWLSRDLKPFSTISSDGFRDFAISTGLVETFEDLPSDRAIAGAALNDVFLMIESSFKNEIKKVDSVFTVMSDLWTDSSASIPYINISVQFMNNQLKMKAIHLTTEKLDRPHTKEIIAKCIEDTLKRCGLTYFFYYVTDGGRNMVASANLLKDCIKHFKCGAHGIDIALSSDMMNLVIWKENVIPVLSMIKRIHGSLAYKKQELKTIFHQQQSKEIFQYLEECELTLVEQISADEDIIFDSNEILSGCFSSQIDIMTQHSVFQTSVATRWNSNHLMIKTFLKNYASINTCLAQLNKTELILNPEQFAIVLELNKFFECFDQPLKVLQTSTEPTSHMVILVVNSIIKKLKSHADDEHSVLKDAFVLASNNLNKRIKIEEEWIAAALLDPVQVNSTLIANELEKIQMTKKELLSKFVEKFDISGADIDNSSNISENPQEAETSFAKRLRLEMLNENISDAAATSGQNYNLDREIEKYFYLTTSISLNVDIIKFWLANKNELPILFKLTQIILGLSPTSSFCEHSFSLSGAVLNKKRSKLNPVLASKQLFIGANYKMFEETRDN